MSCIVSFITPRANGIGVGNGAARVRVRETLTVPGTTTATALEGEMVIIGNGEAGMVAVAFGSTPDADATAEIGALGAVSTAGFPVSSGSVSLPLILRAGDKINVKSA